MASFKTQFASNKQDWETPDSLFVPLDSEFHFTLDVCASVENKKCENFISKEQDGLKIEWGNSICWANVPFKNKKKWIERAYEQSTKGATVVCLVPARTNTNWFQDYCLKYGEVRFVRGRPKFNGAEHGLPQPLAIVVFRPV